ncbi:hypothetical protein SAMN05444722_1687 [Rhodovulum sp. ES.010]|uniref:phage tail tube protein n=1 Tax=Rhodovulum sp. ES.010 TaxID=1882821 RepID=UPI000929B19E|nr:phage tail tube protein [Rhodovulum sp. ES.010]SIO36462.1 hypothetical protein SAMN05444722_1687 [Rhodovulum sp. ES.010]
MAEVASQADIAYQYEMWIGRTVDETTTWTQILGVEDLPFPEQVPDDIDVTHQQSPGRTRETKPGMLAAADASFAKQFWSGHAGDTLLDELAALSAAGTPEDVLIEFNTGGDTPAIRRTFRGYVNHFTPGGTVGEKAMVNVALKIFELQATNDRVIS